jgi:hypothetical protein
LAIFRQKREIKNLKKSKSNYVSDLGGWFFNSQKVQQEKKISRKIERIFLHFGFQYG